MKTNRLILLVLVTGLAGLVIDLRAEHVDAVQVRWQAWVPIVFAGVGAAVGAVALLWSGSWSRFALLAVFGSSIAVGLLGFWLHNRGHPFQAIIAVASAWTDPNAHRQDGPPHLAPLAFAGLGVLGLLAAMGLERSEKMSVEPTPPPTPTPPTPTPTPTPAPAPCRLTKTQISAIVSGVLTIGGAAGWWARGGAPTPPPAPAPAPAEFASVEKPSNGKTVDALAVLRDRCAACHQDGHLDADQNFVLFDVKGVILAIPDAEKSVVAAKVRNQRMPPPKNVKGIAPLTNEEITAILDWLQEK